MLLLITIPGCEKRLSPLLSELAIGRIEPGIGSATDRPTVQILETIPVGFQVGID